MKHDRADFWVKNAAHMIQTLKDDVMSEQPMWILRLVGKSYTENDSVFDVKLSMNSFVL